MNLQQLYYFKTIAELEHYTKASKALNISQSSLSHAMQSLEREFNVKLFVRSGRNVVLSQYGRMFLPHVEQALAMLESGVAQLREAVDSKTGIITVACFPSLAQFVPSIVARYVSETNHLDVRLQINQETTYYTLREHLLSGKVDIVFSTKIDDPRVGSAPIGEQDFVLLAPHDHRFARRKSVDIHELDGEDYIAYSKDSQLRHQLDELFRNSGIRPRITTETSQDFMIYGLVAAGRGVAITPYPLGEAPYNVTLVPVREPPRRELYLMWNRETYLTPAAAHFRDFVIGRGLVFDEYQSQMNIK